MSDIGGSGVGEAGDMGDASALADRAAAEREANEARADLANDLARIRDRGKALVHTGRTLERDVLPMVVVAAVAFFVLAGVATFVRRLFGLR